MIQREFTDISDAITRPAKKVKPFNDKWDSYEIAAEGASKLKSIGMNVDAMATMTEKNPAKRMFSLFFTSKHRFRYRRKRALQHLRNFGKFANSGARREPLASASDAEQPAGTGEAS